MKITGYKYITEIEAINAQILCNSHYGVPYSPDDVTQNWVGYSSSILDSPNFWYIVHHESLDVVLGLPVEFDVTFPEI